MVYGSYGVFRTNHIACPADSTNHFGIAILVDLTAKMTHIDVDNIRDAIKTLVPHMLDDHVAREHSIRILHQVFEQRVLLCRQLNALAMPLDLLRQPIKFKVANAQCTRAVHRSTAQQRLYPNEKFREREWLGKVIIG